MRVEKFQEIFWATAAPSDVRKVMCDLEVIEEDGQVADADLGPSRRRRAKQGEGEGAEDKGTRCHGGPLYRSRGDGNDGEG